jgi:ribosomal-protein-alanine N-acetyltransferase
MRFDVAPALPIDGLCLRALDESDLDAWFAYLSVPGVLDETSWQVKCVEDLRSAAKLFNSEDPSTPIRFAISRGHGQPLIGSVGFHTIASAHRTAEIAYDLHPSYWGEGIGSDCCTALTNWGFLERGYLRVQAVVLETNMPSISLLEKCGFAFEGKLRNYRVVRGCARDFLMYSKLPAG